ncbi:DUF6584 family protein, partial [Fulvivirga kasyanovii]|uniref:DUF6584 family protein n=1 Tax=Fulvivirga kasyanovii TaxID=396812 RepID=UPI0031D70940
YIQKQDKIRAGRHLFLKEDLSELEIQCVKVFEKSCGNSPTLILKNIITKENYRIKELSDYQKNQLKKLITEAIDESGVTPNFLKGIKQYLDKIKAGNTVYSK